MSPYVLVRVRTFLIGARVLCTTKHVTGEQPHPFAVCRLTGALSRGGSCVTVVLRDIVLCDVV